MPPAAYGAHSAAFPSGRGWLKVGCSLLLSLVCASSALAAPAASAKRLAKNPPAAASKAAAPVAPAPPAAPASLSSAVELDLERFMGLWYKVAKVDEPQEALRTRERYEFLQRYDGGVRVIATSYDPLSNRWDRRQDYMAPVDTKGAAFSSHYQLAMPVHFSISRFGPFGVSYYVVALDPSYQWAMVSGPGPQSFSILSRKSELEPELRSSLEQLANRMQLLKAPLRWPGPEQQ
ncbi:lipocalin family protein [Comamonas piscis]|uniref:Lipocalin family protein n=1 Tax=Comamonas piscis TaxID=1562974 RepID=A0A7G5EJR3_9BURK|nr:lipocalin family protein [Comamonas piscis]QMV74238.1 lipocalin family protein [Comamonas piscis]WSO32682.1 lipocalin family protein [Comamonas piscis]